MRITGVLRGDVRMCKNASAIAVSSAVLFVRTVAPRCSGSEGVTETGPKSYVCIGGEEGVFQRRVGQVYPPASCGRGAVPNAGFDKSTIGVYMCTRVGHEWGGGVDKCSLGRCIGGGGS